VYVNTYIKRNNSVYNFKGEKVYSNLGLTIDEPDDLNVLRKIIKYFKYTSKFSYGNIFVNQI
jgi:spore coat polysaccharide biosynthesis protein SpsF (cytidylyltransferase family)